MIVIALIMILSVVGIGSFTLATIKSKDAQRKNDINQMAKAMESFMTDTDHYPLSETSTDAVRNTPHCYQRILAVATNTVCDGKRLYSVVDGAMTPYINIPSDPDPAQSYTYISTDGYGYALYAALANAADRDLIKNEDGTINQNPWGVSCGSVSCNYKVTETGLVKSL